MAQAATLSLLPTPRVCRHVPEQHFGAAADVDSWDVLPQELLSTVQRDCELHYVGKRGGQPSIKQQDIDQLLVTLCKQVSGVE